MPLELQPKLLRALQEKEFERLGGADDNGRRSCHRRYQSRPYPDGQPGEFRRDLYYRLRVFPILVPPLRDRSSDIPLLVHYFVNKHAKRMGKRIATIPPETMTTLCAGSGPAT